MVLICVPSLEKDGLNGTVSQHFGKTPYFVLINWEDEKIESVQVLESNTKHTGGSMTPGEFIAGSGANELLCGNLGPKAIQMLQNVGINVYVGASGTVAEAVQARAEGKLKQANMDSACSDGH
ncbi:MAG: NifB/NifX family molybdenum-iron cluster-binding protein [Euryarchaeota archaeon]|jgi:predicted Fe-Mo cluster-binding NifX family protein|uniref:NifB/NifX family molybdenum-iron cluster-binding protein n=1 Tax=Methanobacterium sp. MZD130B TaxID=3394378 RepID=UPI00176D0EDA|nr:NifB/NifX family molybdenum-iron cluster-binding protein [Euryarchaeota archaeon]HHT18066.1 dinitrogenase iron-molybdenum cofactor biosynthesis protein [Methanobacterium sp.]